MTVRAFNPNEYESKWAARWVDEKTYKADDVSSKPKSYLLIEFPYPSGERLHVGHARSYSCLDAVARLRRMKGFNVMYPLGWDAFGLPAENYAIKTGVHPSITTLKNIENAKKQAISWGLSFDWDREINTTDSKYYKWTQWIFLQLYKKGLAYKKEIAVNWCPSCKINLADEEVIEGKCERCGTQTERRTQSQWLLKITEYADRLLEDLETVNYREDIKLQQQNWIGRKEGAKVKFEVMQKGGNFKTTTEVFTTRLDTIFGVTFVVLAPEVGAEWLKMNWNPSIEVKEYIDKAINTSEEERQKTEKNKTGVNTGLVAINPANGEEIPVYVADYVLKGVGTGVVMGVPGHDSRDLEFAKKHSLNVKQVIAPYFPETEGKDAVREGEETQKRKTVYALLRNPKTNEYLCLDWEKFGWRSTVIGGAEEGESYAEAGKRETMEETGYSDLKFVYESPSEVHNNFYASHKNVNRYAFGKLVIFEMVSEKRNEIDPEEATKHKIVWIKEEEMSKFINLKANSYLWREFVEGWKVYEDEGVLIDSGKFSDLKSSEAVLELLKSGVGEKMTHYHLRDWVFSRQHYWGEPIPMVWCEKCKEWLPVNESDLPITLPQVEKYQPTDNGESPLANMIEWLRAVCPKCGGEAKRETDTMPNWAGSSWYFLRYIDPDNDSLLASKEKLKYWLPVDWYNGGMEHTTLHLLYSRFWHKFLFDLGVVPTAEPYAKRTSHGVILGPDGRKMSKSKGNVINPDDVIGKYGADTLRMYEMFIGPFSQSVAWSWESVEGVYRFLRKVWNLYMETEKITGSKEATTKLAKLAVKVESDIENMKFNTMVASMMEFVNWWEANKEEMGKDLAEKFLIVLSPAAPFMTEELWNKKESIHKQSWPVLEVVSNPEELVTVVVQVSGKVRGKLLIERKFLGDVEMVKRRALEVENVSKFIDGEVKKTVYVEGRLINFV